ncbi:MAG: hypothetical protein ACFB20_12720 [Opitutales bacterium]
MPTWIQLTPQSLRDYLSGPQLEALQTAALASGQTDPLPRLIEATAAFVRASVAAFAGNQLSATPHSVPPELVETTAILALEAAWLRLPDLELTRAQQRRAVEARRLLRDVTRGQLAVTRPDDPLAANTFQNSGALQVERSRPRTLTGDSLQHL